MKIIKYIVEIMIIVIIFTIINLFYWTTSDRQQQCVAKLENNKELNLYEKCSIYSIHVAIFTIGQVISPESATQQFYMSYPHGKKLFKTNILDNLKIGTVKLPYTLKNARVACTVNTWHVKEKVINNKHIKYIHSICKYDYIHDDTIILGFRFNEGLFNYLQKIGWLFPYEIEYQQYT
jgi:hypothetical protein